MADEAEVGAVGSRRIHVGVPREPLAVSGSLGQYNMKEINPFSCEKACSFERLAHEFLLIRQEGSVRKVSVNVALSHF
jgi:hypothetical protein